MKTNENQLLTETVQALQLAEIKLSDLYSQTDNKILQAYIVNCGLFNTIRHIECTLNDIID